MRTSRQSVYRDRFVCAINHQPVDRPPMDLAATDMTEVMGGVERLADVLGVARDREAVLRALDIDFRSVGGVLIPSGPLACRLSDTEYVDGWGIGYRLTGGEYQIVHHPLAEADCDDLDAYPWPDPDAIPEETYTALGYQAKYLHDRTPYVVCARHPVFGILELGCWMCGYDGFLERMAADSEFVERFFDHVERWQIAVESRYFAAVGPYVHMTTSGDDFGTQNAPLISPAMFASMVAPRLRCRIERIRTYTDAVFFHHTCGAVKPLIPALISCGVQVLNPIQPTAADMDPVSIKRQYGDQLVLHGAVDTQHLLRVEPPDVVASEVRRLVSALGERGGYILAPAHVIHTDIPDACAVAMYTAITGAEPVGSS